MILLFSTAPVALPVSAARRDSRRRLAQQASRCSKGCRSCQREEIRGGRCRSKLPIVKKGGKMKKKKQKKTDAAGKYTRPAAGPGGSGPGISSGPYGGAQQLPALQTIPFQPLQIQQEPMRPLPLAPGCERGASRGTKERTPADPAGICGATFERSENGVASTLPPAGATTGQRGFAQRNGAERRQAPGCERGASRGTKERTPADPAGMCPSRFRGQ